MDRHLSSDDPDLDFAAAEDAGAGQALSVRLDAFEGPLHLLLDLARAKKIDLAQLSVSDIADQYLAFIHDAQAQNFEIAGDYLVMAAWLALLKSRLLLPKPQRPVDEPDADDVARALRLKLQRLERARKAADLLNAMPQLGRDVFLNADPEPIAITRETAWKVTLHDLLGAYCAERTKGLRKRAYRTLVRRAFPLEAARTRLEQILPKLSDWRAIEGITPEALDTGPEAPPQSSYLASTFGAALELTREGKLELRQAEAKAPLLLRRRAKAGRKLAEGKA